MVISGRLIVHAPGQSQGRLALSAPLPADVVGCVAVCGGGEIATGQASLPPLPPPSPPSPPPPPHDPGGVTVAISSGRAGAFSLNGVPLAPSNSARPRPDMLTLRVIVDRSVVEGFAQAGRATIAQMRAGDGGIGTSIVWRPSASLTTATVGAETQQQAPPTISLKIWSMKTGYAANL